LSPLSIDLEFVDTDAQVAEASRAALAERGIALSLTCDARCTVNLLARVIDVPSFAPQVTFDPAVRDRIGIGIKRRRGDLVKKSLLDPPVVGIELRQPKAVLLPPSNSSFTLTPSLSK